jgi:hypothetical protein
MHRWIAAAVAVAVAAPIACTRATLTPQAEAVRVTSSGEAVRGCRRLGDVEGGDHLNGTAKSPENARRFLKRNADRMGANTVLLTTTHTDGGGTTMLGEAYACPTTP